MIHTFYDRILAVVTIIVVLLLTFTTNVGLSLWFIGGPVSEVFAFLYIMVMLAIVRNPEDVQAHKIAGGMGLLFWSARAIGFFELIYASFNTDNVRWDLGGAVGERFLIVTFVILAWHNRSLQRIAYNEELSSIIGKAKYGSESGDSGHS